MDGYDDSAMIALLPINSDWCKLELPHLTLVYCGLVKDMKKTAYNHAAKDAVSISMLSEPITLQVLGVDVFGDEDKVDVLKLRPSPELLAMRSIVESWNASEHPFNPHATIGPQGSAGQNIPNYLTFDRIMVAWGKDNLTFWLRRR